MPRKNEPDYILWTTDEWNKVATETLFNIERGVSSGLAVIAAMQTLPLERRRPTSCRYNIVAELRKNYFSKIQAAKKSAPAAAFAEQLANAPSLDLSAGDADVAAPTAVDSPLAGDSFGIPARRVGGRSFEDSILASMTGFARTLAQRFEEELLVHLHAATEHAMATVDNRFQQRLTEARKAVKVNRVELPRVLIVGLQGNQPTDISNEYGEMLDLRFVEATASTNLIRSGSKHADYVVLITKFISHHHQEAVREHPGLIYVNGSTSELKQVLLPLACR